MPNIKIILSTLLLLPALYGCGQANPKAHLNETPIASCDVEEMAKIGDLALNLQDKSEICQLMSADIKRKPPQFLLEELFYTVVQLKNRLNAHDTKEIAAQTMGVINKRHQEADDMSILNTIRTVKNVNTLNDIDHLE